MNSNVHFEFEVLVKTMSFLNFRIQDPGCLSEQ